MVRYLDIENSSDVIDVLCCIVLGYDNVKQITKILDQPQSTVSNKLQSLRKSKLVIKSKWEYKPNWPKIQEIMYKLLEKNIRVSVKPKTQKLLRKGRKKIVMKTINPKDYFTDELLKLIIERYAQFYFATYENKLSLDDLTIYFLVGLKNADDKDLRKLNIKLVELKKILIKIPSKEDLFFMELTDDLIAEETKEVAKDMMNSLSGKK